MFLQVLGGLFLALVFSAIVSWIICIAIKINRNKNDVKILQSRVKFLEDTLHSVLCREKKKIEAEKKIAICNLKKK